MGFFRAPTVREGSRHFRRKSLPHPGAPGRLGLYNTRELRNTTLAGERTGQNGRGDPAFHGRVSPQIHPFDGLLARDYLSRLDRRQRVAEESQCGSGVVDLALWGSEALLANDNVQPAALAITRSIKPHYG